jgi:hypothetical protein
MTKEEGVAMTLPLVIARLARPAEAISHILPHLACNDETRAGQDDK